MHIGLKELAELLDGMDFGESNAAGVADFFDIPTSDAFNVPPTHALAYFTKKGLRTTLSYADMIGEAHDKAFTVAKMMDVDMLGQVRASLESALANGTPFRQWASELLPVLQSGGWAGRKAVRVSGAEVVPAITEPWRLQTIFRTNLQTAYAAGQQRIIDSQADIAPFLMYDAVDDHRTRPSHKARDGTILPVGHPWWRRNTPPLGYNCRCGRIQLDGQQIEAMGLEVDTKPPKLDDVPWTNPRTGERSTWPEGVDPGFGRIPGAADLERVLAEKIAQLPQQARQAVGESLDDQAKRRAITEATMYGAGAGGQTQALLLADAQRRAAVAEKQIAAQAQIDALARGGSEYERAALAELESRPDWRALSAVDRLRDLKRLARELENKKPRGG